MKSSSFWLAFVCLLFLMTSVGIGLAVNFGMLSSAWGWVSINLGGLSVWVFVFWLLLRLIHEKEKS